MNTNTRIRIVVDGMGGDRAPRAPIEGAIEVLRAHPDIEVVLVGREEELTAELRERPLDGRLTVVHAPEVVAMDERPTLALQKTRSSLAIGLQLVARNEAEAFVSAGNSGAIMASALSILGPLPHLLRPAIAIVLPAAQGPVLFLDVGANAECRPAHLVQFAFMGTIYMTRVLGVASPRVALLSMGEEPGKGNTRVRRAFELLSRSHPNFIGNVEGHHLFQGLADVVVTDGFTGNVVLKALEGAAEVLFQALRRAVESQLHYRAAGLVLRPALESVVRVMDYAEYGGAPLLGLNGAVIVAHGRSDGRALRNAIGAARQAVTQGLVEAVRRGLEETRLEPDAG